jgi:hypothetical protein
MHRRSDREINGLLAMVLFVECRFVHGKKVSRCSPSTFFVAVMICAHRNTAERAVRRIARVLVSERFGFLCED